MQSKNSQMAKSFNFWQPQNDKWQMRKEKFYSRLFLFHLFVSLLTDFLIFEGENLKTQGGCLLMTSIKIGHSVVSIIMSWSNSMAQWSSTSVHKYSDSSILGSKLVRVNFSFFEPNILKMKLWIFHCQFIPEISVV